MKNNVIFTVFKKELARFFKDRRTLIALLLPGILLYVIYSLMGGAMSDAFMPDEEYVPEIRAVALPDSIETICLMSGIKISNLDKNSIETCKDTISNGGIDLLLVFPENFDDSIANSTSIPNVEIYYNSSSSNSSMAYQTMVAVLDAYESMMANKFDINLGDGVYDLAAEEDFTAMIFSMIMPMLLVMLLFSGCMAVAPESISGEKERGTIASLLVTPAKRSHIAIGKILALSIMALISGASSTLGIVLSLPKLMGDTVTINGSVYGVTDYLMLAVIILSTVLVLITIISIISAYAKTVKEAGTYVTPLMIASMLIGLTGMFGSTAQNPALYLIPIYNSVQSMIGIFSFEANIVHMLITVGVNVIFTGIGVFVLTRMFNSEKIMFNK
jgi:sodium transport system permease protein